MHRQSPEKWGGHFIAIIKTKFHQIPQARKRRPKQSVGYRVAALLDDSKLFLECAGGNVGLLDLTLEFLQPCVHVVQLSARALQHSLSATNIIKNKSRMMDEESSIQPIKIDVKQ